MCVLNQALTGVRSTGAGIKCLYCSRVRALSGELGVDGGINTILTDGQPGPRHLNDSIEDACAKRLVLHLTTRIEDSVNHVHEMIQKEC